MKDLPRILSGLGLIALVFLSVFLGKTAILCVIFVFSAIAIWELTTNFFKFNLEGKFFNYLIFGLISFSSLYFIEKGEVKKEVFLAVNAVLNLVLLVYLFQSSKRKVASEWIGIFPLFPALFISLDLVSLSSLLLSDDWMHTIALLLLITYGMDTGGWFFGKNFGKNKLSPKISPNKTVEGLVGGALFSGTISSVYLYYFGSNVGWEKFLLLSFFGALTHLGDLTQSKLKREVNLKDSSNLIPGHGGVFDRVDSLYFIGPFYVLFLGYLV
ncbi:MAG: hypothetical protein CME61_03855 [Halobacteriovoraceae bacterium]|nr:hypothetical protein [Halobacteriovoraceae bacterium]